MRIGESVEVFSTFDQTWLSGFQLVGTSRDDRGDVAFVVQRASDGAVLPARFPREDVRADARPVSTSNPA